MNSLNIYISADTLLVDLSTANLIEYFIWVINYFNRETELFRLR